MNLYQFCSIFEEFLSPNIHFMKSLEDNSKFKVTRTTFEKVEFPELLYKYRTWSNKYHQRFITEREVYLASPESFEDELDCHNPTRYDLLTQTEIFEFFVWSSKKENPNFTRQQHREFAKKWRKESLINNEKEVEKYMDESVEEYYQHEGILSLTANFNNDSMWEKYAEDEKGFCIGYNSSILLPLMGGGGEVTYTNEIPKVFPEPKMDFTSQMVYRAYYKEKKWQFEEEYRTRKFYPNPVSQHDRRVELPIEAFAKVILGNQISDKNRKELIEAVKNNIGDIEIVNQNDL